jgi:hypothetical protein
MTKLVEEDPVHIVDENNVTPPRRDDDGRAQTVVPDTARQSPRSTSIWVLVAAFVAFGIAVACQLSGDMGISRSYTPQIVGALL